MSDINDRGRGHDPAPKRHAEAHEVPADAPLAVEPAGDLEEPGEAIIDRSGALIATHAPPQEH